MEKVEKEEKKDTPATLRADFMRRWFAIAISVGFATTVVKMNWVIEGTLPNVAEQEQLARLFVALLATLLSWEGYLLSIQEKPLFDFPRYFLDVCLVFVYLFLLLTSNFHHFWIPVHAITFFMYIGWDFLTICMYRDKFQADKKLPISIWSVYWDGFWKNQLVNRGPVITLLWAAYFGFLWTQYRGDGSDSTLLFMIFVLSGLGGYRFDKNYFRNKAWVTPTAVISLSILVFVALKCLKYQ